MPSSPGSSSTTSCRPTPKPRSPNTVSSPSSASPVVPRPVSCVRRRQTHNQRNSKEARAKVGCLPTSRRNVRMQTHYPSGGSSMKLSARNQLAGKVKSIKRGAVMGEVIVALDKGGDEVRSEEHTSELQSLTNLV